MTRPRTAPPRTRSTARKKSGGDRLSVVDVYIADPDSADLCAKELQQKGKAAPDGVVVRPAAPLVDACFAHQVLPRARMVRGAGPNDLGNAILELVPDAVLRAGETQVTAPEMARHGSAPRPPHPLDGAAAQLHDILRKKIEGRAHKQGEKPATGHVLRVLLVDAWGAYASIERDGAQPDLLAWPSRHPGGRLLEEDAKDAPSSAHRKIEEALRLLGDEPRPDELVVDLGAAPGGWTHVMIERGARVIAVDRADLDDKLERHPRVTHVRADAFGYAPPEAPTWWLCDVIAEPERTIEIARQALLREQTRALVFTLKLTRPVDLAVLEHAKRLAAHTPGFVGRVKHLRANKLEVTLLMKRASPTPL